MVDSNDKKQKPVDPRAPFLRERVPLRDVGNANLEFSREGIRPAYLNASVIDPKELNDSPEASDAPETSSEDE